MSSTGSRQRDWPVYRVGLTGGITASGKSTAASMCAALGVPVIDTDVIARQVVLPGTAGLSAVVGAFGRAVLKADGSLDRRRLRDLAFSTPESRQRLEAILHPLIAAELETQSAAAGRSLPGTRSPAADRVRPGVPRGPGAGGGLFRGYSASSSHGPGR